MAFMNRGGIPIVNVNVNSKNDNSKNDNTPDVDIHRHYYTYVPLDNTYVTFQIIVTLLILVIGVITYIFTYKSTIVDPIETMKKSFLNTYLIIISVFSVLTLVINFFSKDKLILVRRLIIILAISLLIMCVYCGIKLNMDKTYNKEEFKKIYEQQINSESSKGKNKLDIGITGISFKDEKEYYIDECMKLYDIFKIKTYGIIVLHVLLNMLLIYQIYKLSKIQSKKDKLSKDDLIIFDEEQNCRY